MNRSGGGFPPSVPSPLYHGLARRNLAPLETLAADPDASIQSGVRRVGRISMPELTVFLVWGDVQEQRGFLASVKSQVHEQYDKCLTQKSLNF